MIVHPDLFKPKRAITPAHVRSVWSRESLNATDKRIQELVQKTLSIKKDCADWSHAQVSTRMLTFAVDVGLHCNGHLVTNFSDIRKSWQSDPSEENQKKSFTFFLVALMQKLVGKKRWNRSIWNSASMYMPMWNGIRRVVLSV